MQDLFPFFWASTFNVFLVKEHRVGKKNTLKRFIKVKEDEEEEDEERET